MTPVFSSTKRAVSLALSVGLFLFAVYLFTYRGGFHSVDEVSTFAVTENLVKFGQLNTNQIAWTQWTTTQSEAQGFFGRDGDVYSKKGLAISLFQAPLYWLALQLPGLGMLQSVSLLNALLTAATASLLVLILQQLGFSVRAATVSALLYGLATIAWVYAKYLFSGVLAGFLLTLTFYLLLRYKQDANRPLTADPFDRLKTGRRPPSLLATKLWLLPLAGFTAGLTVLARANNLLLLAVFGLYLFFSVQPFGRLRTGRSALRQAQDRPVSGQPSTIHYSLFTIHCSLFIAGAAIAGSIFLWYNWARSGNPFQTGYDLSIFSPDLLLGLYKLLFSPLRGLFIYSPILILSIPGWFKLKKRRPAEAWLVAGLVGATLLLFSAWTSGEGLSWGSRFLLPIVPFLSIALAPMIDQLPIVFIAFLAGISGFIQILGVAINPWVFLGNLQAQFGGEFFLEKTAALYDFSSSQIVGQLQNWRVENSDLIWWQPNGFDGLAFGLGLALIFVTAWLLYDRNNLQTRRSAACPEPVEWVGSQRSDWGRIVVVFVLTAAATFFLIARYYHTDTRQFGAPDSGYLQALNRAAQQSNPLEPIVTVAETSYHAPMNYFKDRVPLLGFARSIEPLPDTAYPLLENLLNDNAQRVWLVTVGRQPAETDNRAEAWLAQNAFKATDYWLPDAARLVSYGVPLPAQTVEINKTLGRHIRLQQAAWPQALPAGQILPVSLIWRAQTLPAANYTVFLQLIAADGNLAAQHDAPPQGGYRPTKTWTQGEQIRDQHGLPLPASLSPGPYRLIAGLYNPANGQRLTTPDGADFVDLGAVQVTNDE